jgi:hypothetical protein
MNGRVNKESSIMATPYPPDKFFQPFKNIIDDLRIYVDTRMALYETNQKQIQDQTLSLMELYAKEMATIRQEQLLLRQEQSSIRQEQTSIRQEQTLIRKEQITIREELALQRQLLETILSKLE